MWLSESALSSETYPFLKHCYIDYTLFSAVWNYHEIVSCILLKFTLRLAVMAVRKSAMKHL